MTDANGCTNTSTMIAYTEPVVPGVANLQDFDINIYPNPFKEETIKDIQEHESIINKSATLSMSLIHI